MIHPARLLLIAALTACGGDPAERPASAAAPRTDSAAALRALADSPAAVPPPVGRDALIRPRAPQYDYTVLDTAAADLDGDTYGERVELAATVELDAAGQPMWEDGHQWMVAVRDGADTYPLVERFVPWGGAAFWIVVRGGAGLPEILVQTSTHFGAHGGTSLEKFVFDPRRGGYVRTGEVESAGVAVYRGPPGMPALLPPTRPAH
jgi:hypothetical protein